MKKLRKLLAFAMAFVMIAGVGQSMIQVEAGEQKAEYEYEQLDQAPMKASASASTYANHSDWGDGPAADAFDGNNNSGWHSDYDADPKPQPPHWIAWELGGTYNVGRIAYTRKSTAANGTWKEIVVTATLADGTTKDVYTGTLPETADGATTNIDFEPVEAKALKVTINSSYNKVADNQFAAAGEINVYKATEKVPEIDYTVTVTPETYTMNEGESKTIAEMGLSVQSVPELPEDATITWNEMNGNILQMRDGIVTAVGEGTADLTVSVRIGNKTYNRSCEVTVNKVEMESVIVLNGVEYRVNSLEEAVTKSGLISKPVSTEVSKIESIEFKSGVVRRADFDFINAHKKAIIPKLKRFVIGDDVVLRNLGNGEIPLNAFYISSSTTGGLEQVYLGGVSNHSATMHFLTTRI